MSKLIKTHYPASPPVAPVPPVAPTPGWTETKRHTEQVCYDRYLVEVIDPATGKVIGFYIAPGFCVTHTVTEKIEHPATAGSSGSPGVPGQPADYQLGWNAGAVSVTSQVGNGGLRFYAPDVAGVIVGIRDTQTLGYETYLWALYSSGSRVVPWEGNKAVASVAPVAANSGTELVIARIGQLVKYIVDGEVIHTTVAKKMPPEVWASASLYRGFDEVVDAAWVPADEFYVYAAVDGGVDGVLSPLVGWFSEDGSASLTAALRGLEGELTGSYSALTGKLPGLRASIGGGGLAGLLEGYLPNLVGRYDAVPKLPTRGDLTGYLQPLSAFMLALPGTAGGVEGTLGQLQGFMTNVGHAVMVGGLGQLESRFATPQWLTLSHMYIPFHVNTTGDGLLVERANGAEIVVSPTMTAALSVTRRYRGEMMIAPAMSAALTVARTFRGGMAIAPAMSAALSVSRVLRGEMVVSPAMTIAAQMERRLRGEMVIPFYMGAALRVGRGPVMPNDGEVIVTIDRDEATDAADPDNTDVEMV